MSKIGGHEAPGLEWRKRAGGRQVPVWCAPRAAVKQGFEPSTVQLTAYDHETPVGQAEIAARCVALSTQVKLWLAEPEAPKTGWPAGTIGFLCSQFQIHEDSPYKATRRDTQEFYDKCVKVITATVGKRRVAEVTGLDVRRWHKNWGRPDDYGEPTQKRRAHACVQTLRRVLAFGAECGDSKALKLLQVLHEMRFEQGDRRHQRITAAQVTVFRLKAREMGFPSMARAVTMQFWTLLRQRDVIGEWVADGKRFAGAITEGRWRWQLGLVWGTNISADMVLKKPTSKSNGKVVVEHDLKLLPEVVEELSDIPDEARVGPVIVNETTGLPYKRFQFSKRFRAIADAAGLPKDVWNMDSRAGGISDAFEASAEGHLSDPAAIMTSAGHRKLETTMRYNRTASVASMAVARARARKGKTNGD